MSPKQQRKNAIISLLKKERYGLLAQAISDSRLTSANDEKRGPSEAETALETILFFAQKHLEFLDLFGIHSEPQYDQEGTFHSRHDAFLEVWIELNACGLSDAAIQMLQDENQRS